MYAGRLNYPLALASASENVAFELAGWRTSTGILLRKPILASLQLTPDVARYITTFYRNLVLLQCLLMEKSELHYSPESRKVPQVHSRWGGPGYMVSSLCQWPTLKISAYELRMQLRPDEAVAAAALRAEAGGGR